MFYIVIPLIFTVPSYFTFKKIKEIEYLMNRSQ